jgi:hypothetical protein
MPQINNKTDNAQKLIKIPIGQTMLQHNKDIAAIVIEIILPPFIFFYKSE